MDYFQGIEVEILSNGQSLPLYDDPDAAENHEARTRRQYIEAVTGAKFSIKVTIKPTFTFAWGNAVRVSLGFDSSPQWCYALNEPRVEGPHVLSWVFSHVKVFCPSSSTWVYKDFCFGDLLLTEATTKSQISPAKLKYLGQILVNVQRVNLLERFVPAYSSRSERLPERVAEIPEKLLKGNAVTNSVDLVGATPAREPRPTRHESQYLEGDIGKEVRYRFLYRSKHALKILGCIPRSPSPEADVKTSANLSGISSKSEDQEIQSLRARLALLEGRRGNVKAESLRTPRGTKREHSKTNDKTPFRAESPGTLLGMKRERGETEDKNSPNKRSRTLKGIDIIDLTDD